MIEKVLIKMMWEKVRDLPKDSQWREFTGILEFRGARFLMRCDFKMKPDALEIDKININEYMGEINKNNDHKVIPVCRMN